jgi:hypothetical protein
MKSLLREMSEKFQEIQNDSCDNCDRPKDKCICDDETVEEQNVTGAIAGYNTPAAFAKPGKWKNKTKTYESVNRSTTPFKQKNNNGSKLSFEVMDHKYERLIESYRAFATGDSKTTPEQKVKNTIKEVAKKLHEIETLINHTSRLKTESGLSRSGIGPSADKALTKIAERLTKISERVRSLGE